MTKTIAILALPGAQLLDISGPLDVFAQANVESGTEAYALRVVACEHGPIRTSSGARLMPDLVAGGEPGERVHTLLVAGAVLVAWRADAAVGALGAQLLLALFLGLVVGTLLYRGSGKGGWADPADHAGVSELGLSARPRC